MATTSNNTPSLLILLCTGAELSLFLPVRQVKTPYRTPPKEKQPLQMQSAKKKKISQPAFEPRATTSCMCDQAIQTDTTMFNIMESAANDTTRLLTDHMQENIKLVEKDVVALCNKILELKKSMEKASNKLHKLNDQYKNNEQRQFTLDSIKDDNAAYFISHRLSKL